MTRILNTFTHRVIQLDRYDPDVSWQHHRDRKSAGGVDLAYPYGTTVEAPASGRWEYIEGKGSGGNIGQIHMADGRVIELMHLSATIATDGSQVTARETVCKSGASGYGNARYYDPHLHAHLLLASGKRVNLWDYFTAPSSTASTNAEAIRTATLSAVLAPIGHTEMKLILHKNTTTGDVLHYLVSDTEVLDLAGAGQDEIDTYAAWCGVVIPIDDHRFDYIKNAVAINKARSQSPILDAIND